ncbi:MAG: chorismate synthase [Deltaproteobacteria bacterium]|nr:chorismate synthase [Deltaproteobacteria bacterium]
MPGNTFGTLFRVTTFGESHGPALGAVIDGCPPDIPLSVDDFLPELARRRPGQNAITTARDEQDAPELISGVFEGKTTGMPIAVIVRNHDARPGDYAALRGTARPGHADAGYLAKYGVHDYRGGGRASGRETVARVIAAIGEIVAKRYDSSVIEQNPVRCADESAASRMVDYLQTLKAEGNSAGAIVEIRLESPPRGLGEPVFDKLKADLSKALLSIGSIYGFEFGVGFGAARMTGKDYVADEANFGGLQGGISTGAPIRIRIAVKPASTVGQAALAGRHDPCVAPRVIPVAEAMVAIVLADHYLRQRTLRGEV